MLLRPATPADTSARRAHPVSSDLRPAVAHSHHGEVSLATALVEPRMEAIRPGSKPLVGGLAADAEGIPDVGPGSAVQFPGGDHLDPCETFGGGSDLQRQSDAVEVRARTRLGHHKGLDGLLDAGAPPSTGHRRTIPAGRRSVRLHLTGGDG